MSDCKQSPMALDRQHVYEVTGKCIYCDEMNPVHEEVMKKKKCPGADISSLDKLAAIQQMHGQVSAANARVAGMVAQNKQRESVDESMEYTYDDFAQEANNIDFYVSNLRTMRKYL